MGTYYVVTSILKAKKAMCIKRKKTLAIAVGRLPVFSNKLSETHSPIKAIRSPIHPIFSALTRPTLSIVNALKKFPQRASVA